MKLLFLRKNPAESAVIVFLFVVALLGIPADALGSLVSDDPVTAQMWGMLLSRLFGAALAAGAACHLGLWEIFACRKRSLPFALPALLVAVNNLPILALAFGRVTVDRPLGDILLFAGECLAVAAFEELSFRGLVFPLLLGRFGTDRRGRFWAVVCASALFGMLHLVNLLAGDAPGAVVLQMGYSFLIGAMLAVCMAGGTGIFCCIFLHAVYNFCGLIVPTLGTGGFFEIWDPCTIALTAVLAVCVAACMTAWLLRMRPDDAVRLGKVPKDPDARLSRSFGR